MEAAIVVGVGSFMVPAAAVAGAVGIGLAALATGSGRRGQGLFGYSRRPHGSEHHHYKKKRSTSKNQRTRRLFEVIKVEDTTGCGLKMACELSSIPKDSLTDEGAAILEFIGPPIVPGEEILPLDAQDFYRQARGLGTLGQENCAKHFNLCPIGGQNLLQTVVEYLP